jgi:hypothetical protein
VTRQRLSFATWLSLGLVAGLIQVAQAQTPPASQAPLPPPAATAAANQTNDEEPIGNVVKLTGTATLTRNNASTPLKLKDDIFKNDVLKTSANSTLGITFNDATTFNLTSNAQIAIDNFVYEEGGKTNAALFNIGKGTVAFVASAVAKTGDMKIATPTATLGIRGTSGLVEVPEGRAAAGTNNVNIKLYPDPDGRVGRIEVNGRDGARLGFLTQAASGFAIRPGAGGRFAATLLQISPQQALRDQGFVRQVHAAQNFGRQVVTQQRALRRANPRGNVPGGNNPSRTGPGRQPGLQNQNNNAPNRRDGANRPGVQGLPRQQPGLPSQPGLPLRLPAQPGAVAPSGPPLAPGLQRAPALPSQPGLQRPGRRLAPALPGRPAPSQKRKPPNGQR